jgi:hypothetical protein
MGHALSLWRMRNFYPEHPSRGGSEGELCKLSGSFKIGLKLHRSPLALGGMARGTVVVAGQ